MELVANLKSQFGEQISLREAAPNVFQVYAPFFHSDGDMISMYIETDEAGDVTIRDFGNTLMRVSYTFDLDSDNKRNVLSSIVKSNYGKLDDGELIMKSNIGLLTQSIFQYSQLVAKVSSIDILRRETVKSMFYEYLREFVSDKLSNYTIKSNITPVADKSLVVDYSIDNKTPVYMFGVNDNNKASKVVISCLRFQTQRIPFKSLVIHNDFDDLTNFSRNQLINASDKQFATLDDFKETGIDYLERVLMESA